MPGASRAECFLEEDRQKLLGVIESAFGELRAFDGFVHSLLVQACAGCPRVRQHREPSLTEQVYNATIKKVM